MRTLFTLLLFLMTCEIYGQGSGWNNCGCKKILRGRLKDAAKESLEKADRIRQINNPYRTS